MGSSVSLSSSLPSLKGGSVSDHAAVTDPILIMTDSTDTFRLVSYDCHCWNSGIGLLRDIADLCMIQEHWLFAQQIRLLNFDPAFTSCGVSGMDDDILLKGRPFGGCGFMFRKKNYTILRLSSFISSISVLFYYEIVIYRSC